MKPWLKRIIAAAVAAFALGAGLFGILWAYGLSKMKRVVPIAHYPLAVIDDAPSIERGRYLYNSRGCADCHANNGGGRFFIDDAKAGMRVAGPNISPGPGSVVAGYQPADWERALRHGVDRTGRPLMIMPSEDFARYTDADIAALAAYARQLAPAPGGPAVLELPPLVTVLYALGVIQDAAQKIDHHLAPAQTISEGVTVEHGRYVAQACQGCHGPQLSGGSIPGAPPSWPAAANLTPGQGSSLTPYADARTFQVMLRTGRRPDGTAISPVMPFAALAQMNAVDTEALYLYLKSLAPRAAGQR